MRRRGFTPGAAHHVERVGREACEAMIRRAHHELDAFGDRAEFADYEFVPEDLVVEEDVALFEFRRVLIVVIIGVVADEHVLRADDVLQIHRRAVLIGINLVRVGNVGCHNGWSGVQSAKRRAEAKSCAAASRRVTGRRRKVWQNQRLSSTVVGSVDSTLSVSFLSSKRLTSGFRPSESSRVRPARRPCRGARWS